MSDCKHTIFKNGHPVKVDTLPNKGLSYEDRIGYAHPEESEKRSKKDIWEARREMDSYHH